MRPRPFRQCLTYINVARYPQPMSDRPLTKSAHPERQEPSAREESSSRNPVPVPRWSDASRWPTYAALAIATIAAVLAGLAYFHPAHNGASVAQQGGDAKANACSAYANTRKAVIINTHLESPNPDAQFAVAANARLALIGGGGYLRDRLAANTAAPADITAAANSFATTIEQLGVNYLINATNDVQNPLRQTLNNQINQLDTLCK
jgi:hypothetical protein